MDIPVLFKENKIKRIVKVCFLSTPCVSVYNAIFQRSFFATINRLTSIILLKMKYSYRLGESFVIKADLHGAHLIRKTILNNPFTTAIISKTGRNNDREAIGVVDLDM